MIFLVAFLDLRNMLAVQYTDLIPLLVLGLQEEQDRVGLLSKALELSKESNSKFQKESNSKFRKLFRKQVRTRMEVVEKQERRQLFEIPAQQLKELKDSVRQELWDDIVTSCLYFLLISLVIGSMVCAMFMWSCGQKSL